jgi:hypothetical protein
MSLVTISLRLLELLLQKCQALIRAMQSTITGLKRFFSFSASPLRFLQLLLRIRGTQFGFRCTLLFTLELASQLVCVPPPLGQLGFHLLQALCVLCL